MLHQTFPLWKFSDRYLSTGLQIFLVKHVYFSDYEIIISVRAVTGPFQMIQQI